MVGLHGMEIRGLQAKGAQIEAYARREAIAGQLVLNLEKYRRQSKDFRKLTDGEIEKTKDRLTDAVSDGVAQLDQLSPTPEEKKLEDGLNAKLASFMELSAKIEPTLFLRDVFIKEPARGLHESIVADLLRLQKSAAGHVEQARVELTRPVTSSTKLMLIAASLILAMTALILIRNFLAFVRPIGALRARAGDLSRSPHHNPQSAETPLRGAYGEIEGILRSLSQNVDSLRRERHQFVTAIASDLRAPLVALQAGANMLASVTDQTSESERRAAGDVVNRSLFRLSSSLEDLGDIVEIERSDIRLDEKIVDIRTIITEVAHNLGGPGTSHEVKVSLPTMPIWTMIDPSRFERVLVHLVSKTMNFMPQGGRIDISMARPSRGSFRGLEVVIQDAERLAHGRGAATGPEQDLLRHWVAENGFGMALVSKVVKAHGGTVTASGVAGTGVLFTLRLPQERLGTGMVTPASENGLLDHQSASHAVTFEGSRVQPMFPGKGKAVHFGG